jgi:Stress responsive A/B Barrel Domain
MITHIVCWKYKPETKQDQRENHLMMLRKLPLSIPEIITFNVGFDILRLDRSFDLGLVATYRNRADLDAYTVHPAHQEIVALGKIVAEKVISVDFE